MVATNVSKGDIKQGLAPGYYDCEVALTEMENTPFFV